MNEKYPLALPEGTVLAGQYIIEKVLGQGGFGITYEATDHKTERKVAVKEFFPDAMATRTGQTTVRPFSGERGESYEYGKACFLQEAETLAKFIGNDNIVRIHSYFEENGTAYFVMDFVEGTSFDEYIKQHGGRISYEEAAGILVPVMDALSDVHCKGIIHRDVTPDNIYITKEGTVRLLDFGAARYSLGDKSRSLDVVLKHGFAPKEQYTRRGKQGPYTDVYSLGATFYFALTGKRPQDSVERMDEDDLVSLSTLGVRIDKTAEDAILQALSVQPAERFQSMEEFKDALLGSPQTEAVPNIQQSTSAAAQKNFDRPGENWTGKRKLYIVLAAAVVIAAVIGCFAVGLRKKDAGEEVSVNVNDPKPVSTSGPKPDIPTVPEQTSAPEPSAVPVKRFPVIGNDAGNIMNGGHIASVGGTKYYITDSTYSIKRAGSENGYIYEKDRDTILYRDLSLSVEEGRLYFIYCGADSSNRFQVWYHDLEGEPGNSQSLDELNDHYRDILRLLLTEDYYVISCGSYEKIRTVYRVPRNGDEGIECCTLEKGEEFFLSDEGWIYYTDRDDNGFMSLCRMRLDTLEKDSRSIRSKDADQAFYNPIAAGDFLYVFSYKSSDPSYGVIVRYDKDFDDTKHKPVEWDIGSRMDICTTVSFNVNRQNQDIYCCFETADDGEWPNDLYQLKGHENGSFDIRLISEDSQAPCLVYHEDGSYDVYYYGYHRYADFGYHNFYQSFDKDGNRIQDETPTGNPSGSLSVIGNDVGNIMNGGHTATLKGEKYLISNTGYTLEGPDGKNLYERDQGRYADLSLVEADGRLYYLYDRRAYFYELTGEAGNRHSLSEINDYYGGIDHLFLTEDYYVISCTNSDGTATIYCISRTDGGRFECFTVEDGNGFTLSDDGWIYYTERDTSGYPWMYHMRLDTLEKAKGGFYWDDSDKAFCNPIVAGDFLYFLVYDTEDSSDCQIIRLNRDLTVHEPIRWDIGSDLDIRTDLQEFGFNVNKENHDIYFYFRDDEDDPYPDLYRVKGREDGSFDVSSVSQYARQPCFTYKENGDYEVNFYVQHRYGGVGLVIGPPSGNYLNKCCKFDAEGNDKIKVNIESGFKYFS